MKVLRYIIRLILFMGCIVFVVWLVILKQDVVRELRGAQIASIVSEWDSSGKPVVAYTIKRHDVKEYTKITIVPKQSNIYSGYVPGNIMEKIRAGQDFYVISGGKEIQGRVVSVEDQIDLDTGLYPVEATFDEKHPVAKRYVAHVHTRTLEDVFTVPNEVLDTEKGVTFVWKIINECALRQKVVVKERNGYGAVISYGIDEGDLIIVKGAALLTDGDPVNVIAEKTAGELS